MSCWMPRDKRDERMRILKEAQGWYRMEREGDFENVDLWKCCLRFVVVVVFGFVVVDSDETAI